MKNETNSTIGMAAYPLGHGIQSPVRAADAALYQAKEERPNQVAVPGRRS